MWPIYGRIRKSRPDTPGTDCRGMCQRIHNTGSLDLEPPIDVSVAIEETDWAGIGQDRNSAFRAS